MPVSCYGSPPRKKIVNCGPNQPWGNNAISTRSRQCSTWHSINDRARTILNDCSTARRTYCAKSFGTIASHPGENHTDDIFSKHSRCTHEQRVC